MISICDLACITITMPFSLTLALSIRLSIFVRGDFPFNMHFVTSIRVLEHSELCANILSMLKFLTKCSHKIMSWFKVAHVRRSIYESAHAMHTSWVHVCYRLDLNCVISVTWKRVKELMRTKTYLTNWLTWQMFDIDTRVCDTPPTKWLVFENAIMENLMISSLEMLCIELKKFKKRRRMNTMNGNVSWSTDWTVKSWKNHNWCVVVSGCVGWFKHWNSIRSNWIL